MVEIKNGKVAGDLVIPWDELPIKYLFKYSGIDFSQYSCTEIQTLTGRGETSIINASRDLGIKLQPNRKIPLEERRQMYEREFPYLWRIKMGMAAMEENYSQLAMSIGLSQTTVCKWFTDGKRPTDENFKALAAHFNVPLKYMKGEDNKL